MIPSCFSKVAPGSFLILSLILLILVGWFFHRSSPLSQSYPETVSVGMTQYTLEIADTPEKQARGLGDRDALCVSCAMLFVFERPGTYGFWMKGMRFPLDIAWLSGEKIIHIEREVSADSRTIYRPELPAASVLEFNAGVLAGVRPGDTVHFTPSFR